MLAGSRLHPTFWIPTRRVATKERQNLLTISRGGGLGLRIKSKECDRAEMTSAAAVVLSAHRVSEKQPHHTYHSKRWDALANITPAETPVALSIGRFPSVLPHNDYCPKTDAWEAVSTGHCKQV